MGGAEIGDTDFTLASVSLDAGRRDGAGQRALLGEGGVGNFKKNRFPPYVEFVLLIL